MKNKTLTDSFDRVNHAVSSYIDARLNLLKIQFLEKVTRVGTYFLSSVFSILALFLVLLMLGLAFSFWYGEYHGNIVHGFLISAGIFFLIFLVAFLFRKSIFSDQIVRNVSGIVFEEDEDELRGRGV